MKFLSIFFLFALFSFTLFSNELPPALYGHPGIPLFTKSAGSLTPEEKNYLSSVTRTQLSDEDKLLVACTEKRLDILPQEGPLLRLQQIMYSIFQHLSPPQETNENSQLQKTLFQQIAYLLTFLFFPVDGQQPQMIMRTTPLSAPLEYFGEALSTNPNASLKPLFYLEGIRSQSLLLPVVQARIIIDKKPHDEDFPERRFSRLAQLHFPESILPFWVTASGHIQTPFLERGDLVDFTNAPDKKELLRPLQAQVYFIDRLLVFLQHLEEMQIRHYDLKPDNIFLDSSGIPFLSDLDFALTFEEIEADIAQVGELRSHFLENTISRQDFIASLRNIAKFYMRGSPDYVSPELAYFIKIVIKLDDPNSSHQEILELSEEMTRFLSHQRQFQGSDRWSVGMTAFSILGEGNHPTVIRPANVQYHFNRLRQLYQKGQTDKDASLPSHGFRLRNPEHGEMAFALLNEIVLPLLALNPETREQISIGDLRNKLREMTQLPTE